MIENLNKQTFAPFGKILRDSLPNRGFPKGDEWKYSSFWYKDFDAMAYKTMLRQLISKWGIMSVDLQKAFEEDSLQEQDAEYLQAEEPKIPDPQQASDLPAEYGAGSAADMESGQVGLDGI